MRVHHFIHRMIPFIGIIALVFTGLLPKWSGLGPLSASAGTGASITIPASNVEPNFNGLCDPAEYADATQVQITVSPSPSFSPFTVYLKHTVNYLYVCFYNMPTPNTGNSGFVGLYVDRNDNGGGSDEDDFFLGVHPNNITLAGYWNPSAGAYNGADPGGWSVNSEQCVPGPTCQWIGAEFRISRQTMGGWQHTVGLSLFYHWYRYVGDDYSWPAQNIWANPQLWGNAKLATAEITLDQSGVTPTVDGICNIGNGSEYADAAITSFPGGAFGSPVDVYMKHTTTDLYVCLANLETPSPETQSGPNADVYINRAGTGGETPGLDDLSFYTSYSGTAGARRGSGSGYNGPDPGGYTIARYQFLGELPFWDAEFRISAASLGGGWNRDINIATTAQWVNFTGNDYGWPIAYFWSVPGTWAIAHLTSAPAITPVDLHPTSMEVTQSIQDMNNSVVLIANKRTFVRVHMATSANTNGVTARLYGYRAGLVLGPLVPINPGAKINVITSPRRAVRDDSFLFELPSTWIQPGSLNLTATVNPFHAITENNYTNNTISNAQLISFETANPLDLILYDYRYVTTANVTVANRPQDLTMLESELRRMYPINTLHVTRRTYTHWGGYLSTCPNFPWICLLETPNAATIIAELAVNRSWFNLPDATSYGMVYDRGDQGDLTGTGFVRGMGLPVVGAAAGPSGPSSWGWDFDGTYADWYGAHEIAHTLWRHHTFCVDEPIPYQNYPYPGATLGTNFAGFDAGDGALGLNTAIMPGDSWHDIMSYCNNEWISDVTYNGIRHFLQTGLPLAEKRNLNGPALTGDFLTVAGLIDVTHQAAALTQLSRDVEVSSMPPITPGPYHIRLLNASAAILADYAFTPEPASEDNQKALIFQVVNFIPGTRRISIFSDNAGKEIASANVSAHPPEVAITSRSGGPNLPSSGPVTIGWNGSDQDADSLSYILQYSRDNQGTWRTLATGIISTSLTTDLSQVEGTGGASNGYFRVLANDGVLTASAVNGPFSVAGKAPAAEIVDPANGSSYTYGQVVTLEGYGQDFEDGTIPDGQLSWSSDLDGHLGTGHLLYPSLLSAGTHHISLAVTDSNGQTGTSSIVLTIGAESALPGPTLSVGPGHLYFSGSQFGASPAGQSLSLRNLGSGALSWIASSDAAWVTLGDSSGAAPADITVTVNMNGVWTSSIRQAQITISAVGAANSPQVITVSAQSLTYHPPVFLPVIFGKK